MHKNTITFPGRRLPLPVGAHTPPPAVNLWPRTIVMLFVDSGSLRNATAEPVVSSPLENEDILWIYGCGCGYGRLWCGVRVIYEREREKERAFVSAQKLNIKQRWRHDDGRRVGVFDRQSLVNARTGGPLTWCRRETANVRRFCCRRPAEGPVTEPSHLLSD